MKKPMVVAEIGASHNGTFERAAQTVTAAIEAGADAIKLQTFTADTMVADRTKMITSGPWAARNMYELYAEAAMPWEWQERLFKMAQGAGCVGFSTPFDETAVDFLESIGCPMYKVASFEITDIGLIRRIASTGKPIIISTGMARPFEVRAAIAAAEGCPSVTVLKCTSAYPASFEDMDLAALRDMINHAPRHESVLSFGLSDHSRSNVPAVIATGLGATMIEKHITLSRDGGPDDEFALLPAEFAVMAQQVRVAALCMGSSELRPNPAEATSLQFRRGVYAVADIAPGERFTHDNVKARRPVSEITANQMPLVIGGIATRQIKIGTPIVIGHVSRETTRGGENASDTA